MSSSDVFCALLQFQLSRYQAVDDSDEGLPTPSSPPPPPEHPVRTRERERARGLTGAVGKEREASERVRCDGWGRRPETEVQLDASDITLDFGLAIGDDGASSAGDAERDCRGLGSMTVADVARCLEVQDVAWHGRHMLACLRGRTPCIADVLTCSVTDLHRVSSPCSYQPAAIINQAHLPHDPATPTITVISLPEPPPDVPTPCVRTTPEPDTAGTYTLASPRRAGGDETVAFCRMPPDPPDRMWWDAGAQAWTVSGVPVALDRVRVSRGRWYLPQVAALVFFLNDALAYLRPSSSDRELSCCCWSAAPLGESAAGRPLYAAGEAVLWPSYALLSADCGNAPPRHSVFASVAARSAVDVTLASRFPRDRPVLLPKGAFFETLSASSDDDPTDPPGPSIASSPADPPYPPSVGTDGLTPALLPKAALSVASSPVELPCTPAADGWFSWGGSQRASSSAGVSREKRGFPQLPGVDEGPSERRQPGASGTRPAAAAPVQLVLRQVAPARALSAHAVSILPRLLSFLGADAAVLDEALHRAARAPPAAGGGPDRSLALSRRQPVAATIRSLLLAGADPMHLPRNRDTAALNAAAASVNTQAIGALQKFGGCGTLRREDLPPFALHRALAQGDYTGACFLLQRLGFTAEAAAHDDNGYTPLHHCALHPDHLRAKRAEKAPSDGGDDAPETPARLLAEYKAAVVLLLRAGGGAERLVSENPADKGHSALHLAAAAGHVVLVRLLVAAGVDVAAKGSNGVTAAHEACRALQIAALRELVSKGAAMDIGWLPPVTLHRVVALGRVADAKWLLDAGVASETPDPRMGSGSGWQSTGADGEPVATMPLHVAVSIPAFFSTEDGLAVVRRLATPAAVKARTVAGHTALHRAAFKGACRACTLLLSLDADPHALTANTQNAAPQTPLDLSIQQGHVPTIFVLVQHTDPSLLSKTSRSELGFLLAWNAPVVIDDDASKVRTACAKVSTPEAGLAAALAWSDRKAACCGRAGVVVQYLWPGVLKVELDAEDGEQDPHNTSGSGGGGEMYFAEAVVHRTGPAGVPRFRRPVLGTRALDGRAAAGGRAAARRAPASRSALAALRFSKKSELFAPKGTASRAW
ncbi:Tankyrase [Diplonema papillatum]|nr:Tankyrase [Diplonema papillatum]